MIMFYIGPFLHVWQVPSSHLVEIIIAVVGILIFLYTSIFPRQ